MSKVQNTEIDETYCSTGGYISIDDELKSVINKIAPPTFIEKILSNSIISKYLTLSGTGPRIRIGITGEENVEIRKKQHSSDPLKSGGIYYKMFLIYKTKSEERAAKVEKRLIEWAHERKLNVANPKRYHKGNKIPDAFVYVYVLVGRKLKKKEEMHYTEIKIEKDSAKQTKDNALGNASRIVFSHRINDLQTIHNWMTDRKFRCAHVYEGNRSVFLCFSSNEALREFHKQFKGEPAIDSESILQ